MREMEPLAVLVAFALGMLSYPGCLDPLNTSMASAPSLLVPTAIAAFEEVRNSCTLEARCSAVVCDGSLGRIAVQSGTELGSARTKHGPVHKCQVNNRLRESSVRMF